MRTLRRLPLVAITAFAACSPAAETESVDTTAAPPAAATADPDAATAGGGIPSGYLGAVDPARPGRQPADLAQANYTVANGSWEVRTGPAHVVYAAGDTASGTYTASAAIEQLERPEHPEAFGIFIGGSGLDGGAQRYTYFIVRHTGEAMVRVRDGDSTRTVMDWTASPNVPQADSGGRASYQLAARVEEDSVRFTVNGQQVAAAARSAVPTDGIAGVRINHNLHLRVTPLRIER